MVTLRPYQDEGVEKIRNSFRRGRKAPLFVLPTGGGKTVVFTYIASEATKRGKKALILVHRIELLRQTSKALLKFGVDHGLITTKYTGNLQAPIQIAMVQTMVNRLDKMPFKPDLVITDEAHHAISPTYKKVVNAFPLALKLGVTATPVRTNGAGLSDVFDDLVVGSDIQELIRLGFLVRPLVYAPRTKIDLSGVSINFDGDYASDEVEKLVDTPSIIGDVVSHYRKFCDKEPAIAFCNSIQHAKHVAAEFCALGYKAFSVDGKMQDAERTRILQGLENGSVHLVTSCDLISEGTDIPAVSCAILLRPTLSEALFLQQCGRPLRPYKGKKFAIILDHVGNVFRHGMPDDIREWSLEGLKKTRARIAVDEKTIKVKQCPNCYVMHVPAPKCSECGHVYEIVSREIQKEDGGLAQMGTAEIEALRQKIKSRQAVGRAKTMPELEMIERQRGYKAGWARHVFEAKNKRK